MPFSRNEKMFEAAAAAEHSVAVCVRCRVSVRCFMKWQCAVWRECVCEIADGEKKRKIKFVSDLYERRGREEI